MIIVRHIERTCLIEEPFIELVKKYTEDLQNDILIVFDLRVRIYGFHRYDHEKKLHTIRISPHRNKILNKCDVESHAEEEEDVLLDSGSELVNLISTTLHELCHAKQREQMKQSFFRKDFCENGDCENKEMKEKFSACELECQIYERENVLEAVEFYKSCCM